MIDDIIGIFNLVSTKVFGSDATDALGCSISVLVLKTPPQRSRSPPSPLILSLDTAESSLRGARCRLCARIGLSSQRLCREQDAMQSTGSVR